MPFAPDAPGVGAPPFNALPPPFIVDATAVGKGEDDVDDVVVADAEPVELLLPDAEAVEFDDPVALAAAAVMVIGIAEAIVANTRSSLLTVSPLVTRNDVETETEAFYEIY